MTTIFAKILADSVGESSPRLTSLHLHYPRCIHSELMTHRVFSRNASSSRAKPVSRVIQEILDDPFVPLHWGADQPGMQARAECDKRVVFGSLVGAVDPEVMTREDAWLHARDSAVEHARAFAKAGYAKQVINRLLEPFAHVDVVVTSTEWDNFLKLRDHPDAEPHFQRLAQAVKLAMAVSLPTVVGSGEWHVPYVDAETREDARVISTANGVSREFLELKTSVGRCARVSYEAYEGGRSTVSADVALHDRLAASGHWSPFEHQATPDVRTPPHLAGGDSGAWHQPDLHGNLRGWIQYRKQFSGESGVAA